MPAPRKYPDELRERSVRLVSEAMAEDRSLSLNAAVNRIGPRVGLGSSGRRNTYLMESVAMTRRGRKRNLEKERLYWDLLASGLGTVQACRQVGIGRRTGLRWRGENGCFRRDLGGSVPVTGRYLPLFERERVQTLTAQGLGVRQIGRRLGRSPSTISRELRRGGDRGSYDAGSAHQHAARRAKRHQRSKLAADVWLHDFVQDKLELEWSPAQISGFLTIHHPEHMVSAETIYQGLYLPHRGALRWDLAKKLRTHRTLRQPRRRKDKRATRYIDPGRLIDERPEDAEDRAVAGRWEGDLITGSHNATAIGTLVEPASGYVQLVHLPTDHTAPPVCPAVAATMAPLPAAMRRSLTWDQGAEMAQHTQLRIDTGLAVYLCDPRSPWQRGTNENTVSV